MRKGAFPYNFLVQSQEKLVCCLRQPTSELFLNHRFIVPVQYRNRPLHIRIRKSPLPVRISSFVRCTHSCNHEKLRQPFPHIEIIIVNNAEAFKIFLICNPSADLIRTAGRSGMSCIIRPAGNLQTVFFKIAVKCKNFFIIRMIVFLDEFSVVDSP